MIVLRRQVLDIPLDELTEVDKTFGRMISLDVDAVPEQFVNTFATTRCIAYQRYTISAIFQSFPIQGAYNGSIMLTNGSLLSLGDVSQLFVDSFELGFLVASLKEEDRLVGEKNGETRVEVGSSESRADQENDKLLQELFMDAWGTALIGSGEKWLVDYIRKKVLDRGFHMTNAFGPGQASIPLEMQAILLDNLQASQIGVGLNSHFIMSPKKTVTGIFGIQKEELTDLLKACDLCDLSKTCPTAYA